MYIYICICITFFALTLCYTSFFFFLLYIVFIHVIVHTNNHSIELQIMRKFISSQQLWALMNGTELRSVEFLQMLEDFKTERGTALELNVTNEYIPTLQDEDFEGKYIQLLPPLKECILNHLHLPLVESSYRSLLGNDYIRTFRIYQSATQVRIRGELYGCARSRNKKRSIALIRICRSCAERIPQEADPRHISKSIYRPAILKQFCKHNTLIKYGPEERNLTT